MGRLLYLLGGAAIGLLAPKVISLVKEYYDENIKECSCELDEEVEKDLANPEAVIVPINDESAPPKEEEAAPAGPEPAADPA
jgi:hypothetical protein